MTKHRIYRSALSALLLAAMLFSAGCSAVPARTSPVSSEIRGVSPDFFLDKAESFYDREALTDYINGLC